MGQLLLLRKASEDDKHGVIKVTQVPSNREAWANSLRVSCKILIYKKRANLMIPSLKRLLTAAAALVIVGCASTADIDTSKAESTCAERCSTSYSECLGKFTFFPIMMQHQCTDAMRLCVKACPARK